MELGSDYNSEYLVPGIGYLDRHPAHHDAALNRNGEYVVQGSR